MSFEDRHLPHPQGETILNLGELQYMFRERIVCLEAKLENVGHR